MRLITRYNCLLQSLKTRMKWAFPHTFSYKFLLHGFVRLGGNRAGTVGKAEHSKSVFEGISIVTLPAIF